MRLDVLKLPLVGLGLEGDGRSHPLHTLANLLGRLGADGKAPHLPELLVLVLRSSRHDNGDVPASGCPDRERYLV